MSELFCDHINKSCRRCGYIEYSPPRGNVWASMSVVEKISSELIEELICERCHIGMQIHYQENHRRFYRCLKCGWSDVHPKFYESEQKMYAEQKRRK